MRDNRTRARIERIERQNEVLDAVIYRGVFVLSAILTAIALHSWVL